MNYISIDDENDYIENIDDEDFNKLKECVFDIISKEEFISVIKSNLDL